MALPAGAALCAGQQMNYVKRFRPERHRLDLYNRVFMSRAAEFASQYRAKVQAEYQWAKFEHARQRSAPTRRRKQQPPPPPPQPEQLQVTARAGSTTADPQEQEEEPAPDLEEELQGMFGERARRCFPSGVWAGLTEVHLCHACFWSSKTEAGHVSGRTRRGRPVRRGRVRVGGVGRREVGRGRPPAQLAASSQGRLPSNTARSAMRSTGTLPAWLLRLLSVY